MSNVFDKLIEKAKGTGKRIVLTESEDERVIKAAGMAAEMNLCTVVLLGNKAELEPKYTAEMLKNIEIVEPVVTIRSRMNDGDIPAMEKLADDLLS